MVDGTGKLVATDTIYPHTGQAAKAAVAVAALCEKYNVELVAIGNGTASRETERFFLDVQKQFPKVTAQKVIVSEAGASVYSASELAALEFPDLDVSLRGAGVYRPSFTGSPGGAGENRSEIYRCGASISTMLARRSWRVSWMRW
ncbi:transcription accessory protein [Citrobacter freundii]|nr:transcription accessory protein [Citrobacter freundii]